MLDFLRKMKEKFSPDPDEARKRAAEQLRRDYAGKLAIITAAAGKLSDCAKVLSGPVKADIVAIAASARDMVRRKKSDYEAAAFLAVHLPMVLQLAEKHCAWVRDCGNNDPNQLHSLMRSKELLRRMASAFKKQLDRAEQADAREAGAELDAIDVFLKMRGE